MSFWNESAGLSLALNGLLMKEDVTLQEILDEPEVIQECKSQNVKLIEFLARPEILRHLVLLTTKELDDDDDEMTRYKYANIACEVLTSEAPLLVQSLANDNGLLNELYSFLEADPPLNPLLASFCSRIFIVLIMRHNEQNWFSYQVTCLQVIEFIKSKGNCIELFLRHIGTSAIMDLVHKLYTKIEGPKMKENLFLWLDEGKLVEKLVDMIQPDAPSDCKSNACELLCNFIIDFRERIHENEKPDPDVIIQKIESEELISKLVSVMLQEPRCEGSIVGGISVLLTLLQPDKRDCNDLSYDKFESWASNQGASEPSMVVANVYAAITPHLPTLLDILKNPPYKPPIQTTTGILQTPFGASRVEIVRLLSVLVAAGNQDFLSELKQLNVINVLLDLFFEYPWNNFLHTEVEATLNAAFESKELALHVMTDCRLIQRILNAWEDNNAQEKSSKPRRGYMGHLIKIAYDVVKYTHVTSLESILNGPEDAETITKWQEFVATSLTKVLGDQRSPNAGSEEQDSSNENFYEEALAPSFPENFYRASEFADADENGAPTLVLKPDFNEDISSDNLKAQEALFTQVCAQKLQILDDDDDDDDDDEWKIDIRGSRSWNDDGSSDDESGGPGEDDPDDWPEGDNSVAPLEQSNPWSADVLSASSPDQGWANFESSPFLANFGFDLSSTIATSTPVDLGPGLFDLTPTEARLFSPNESDSDPTPFATVETVDEVQSTEIPQKISPPSDIESPSTDYILTPIGDVPPVSPIEDESMETAEVLETVSSAQVVAFTDVVDQLRELALDNTSSSCLSDGSQSSSTASVIAAFPKETVINQTEALEVAGLPSNIPSANLAAETATELAQLLADVSETSTNQLPVVPNAAGDSESELRTPSVADDVTNGPSSDDREWVLGDHQEELSNKTDFAETLKTNPLVTNCIQTHQVECDP